MEIKPRQCVVCGYVEKSRDWHSFNHILPMPFHRLSGGGLLGGFDTCEDRYPEKAFTNRKTFIKSVPQIDNLKSALSTANARIGEFEKERD